MKLIVPVLNRFDLLKRMLESIDVEATVYIINNSKRAWPLQINNPKVTVWWVHLPSNLGVASSWNLGIKMLPFEDKWIFTQADCYFEPGVLSELNEAANDAVTLCKQFPYWQTFAVGEKVIEQVGLFDEGIHPAYFEDNDFQRRCENLNVRFDFLSKNVFHDNSSTISSDKSLALKNEVSFANNSAYFQNKVDTNDFSEGHWTLAVRRLNSWD